MHFQSLGRRLLLINISALSKTRLNHVRSRNPHNFVVCSLAIAEFCSSRNYSNSLFRSIAKSATWWRQRRADKERTRARNVENYSKELLASRNLLNAVVLFCVPQNDASHQVEIILPEMKCEMFMPAMRICLAAPRYGTSKCFAN